MTIAAFDHLDDPTKRSLLRQCCGSSIWVDKMITRLPAEDLIDLLELAEECWYACTEPDWREAFAHHPKIGDLDSLKQKYDAAAGASSTGASVTGAAATGAVAAGAANAGWASGEQSGVNAASQPTLEALAVGNKRYEEKFGYIFIVCATGRSAAEMLTILEARLPNKPENEITVAMNEQNQITRLRLEKLFA